MPIQPIDLQVLFTQMDKVKAQVAQQEGRVIHQAIQGAQLQQKTEAQIKEVNQAQDLGDGTEKVKDREGRGSGRGAGKKGSENDKGEGNENKSSVFNDPSLGKNIDISL